MLISISIDIYLYIVFHKVNFQFSSVTRSCPTLCNPMNCSTPGLPVHHQLPEFTQTHVHRVSDAIQPSHPLSASVKSSCVHLISVASGLRLISCCCHHSVGHVPLYSLGQLPASLPELQWTGNTGPAADCVPFQTSSFVLLLHYSSLSLPI